MPNTIIKRIDNKNIIKDCKNIKLFSVVRNELLRLPYFLKHYRKLGVNQFFIIDNDSSDDTIEYLLTQQDVYIFYTEQHFQMKEYWLKEIMDKYGMNSWCLAVDADELFIYPFCEVIKLNEFCYFLSLNHFTALESILVDMYPKGDIYRSTYKVGESLIDYFPYYDPFCYYKLLDKRKNYLTMKEFSAYTFFGGTRERYFHVKTCCSKYSLFYYDKGVYIDCGMHGIEGTVNANLRGAVLHFKYLNDFSDRVKEEVRREEHFNNAIQYKIYHEKLKESTFFILYHDKSLKYDSSEPMIEQRIMQINPEYYKFIKYKGVN